MGPIEGPPETPWTITALYRIEGFQRALNWVPIMPRHASLSDMFFASLARGNKGLPINSFSHSVEASDASASKLSKMACPGNCSLMKNVSLFFMMLETSSKVIIFLFFSTKNSVNISAVSDLKISNEQTHRYPRHWRLSAVMGTQFTTSPKTPRTSHHHGIHGLKGGLQLGPHYALFSSVAQRLRD